MLKYLHIENVAVIEQTDIEFSDGFNVLTGETGAGKSIIIDAINAVSGNRTSKDLIRTGADEARISALFGGFSKKTHDSIIALGFETDADGNILIERRFGFKNGYCKVNSKPVTSNGLRELAALLIDIHGQHDNQALLNPETHCSYIDAVADNVDLRENYYKEFKKLNSIRKELSALKTDEDEKARKTELLKFQIKELTEANIRVGEYEELKAQLKAASELEKTEKAYNAALNLLSGDDETDGALNMVKSTKRILEKLGDTSLESAVLKLDEIITAADDVVTYLSDSLYKLSGAELNPDFINQRLDFLQRLMLKYGNTEEQMLMFLNSASSELKGIEFSEEREDELSEEFEESKERLIALAEALTESRTTAAARFENGVSEVLKYLNMPNVRFSVSMQKGTYTKNGCDTVEFLISPNMGEDLKPLHKIASGGELSRVMLAIKSALMGKDTVETMIFDEIDSGLSGYTADKVANQLKKVAFNRQVLCITHLAQIAARADNHLLIEKHETDVKTFTEVKKLSDEDRINELARIMSGSEITNNLYNSAKELLNRSQIDENL